MVEKYFKNKKGYTLIEVILVVGLLAIAAGVVTLLFLSVESNNQREIIVNEIVTTLRKNQSLAMFGQNQSEFGVHFESSKYIEFPGTTYVVNNPENIEHQVPAGTFIENIEFGDGVDIYFKRVTGEANIAGSLEVRVRGLASVKQIIVNKLGTVNVQDI